MPRAETITKLSLYRWAQLMGLHPLHFAGVYVDSPGTCEQPWMQWPWQAADRVSREDVAQAIAQAESDIEQMLGFRLIPSWEIDEWHGTAPPPKPELIRLSSVDLRGFAQTVKANWGYFVSGGIRSKTVVQAAVAVSYADNDMDGYAETATLIVVSSLPPCELHLYLPGKSGADKYEIRPVTAVAAGGNVTFTFKREQCVDPALYDDMVPPADDSHHRGLQGNTNSNFVTTADVYRVYNDPQQQVSFLWEPFGIGCSDCSGSGCEACAYTTQTGCLMVREDPRHSIAVYRPATWNSTTLQFDYNNYTLGRQPDLLRLYYYAGWRDKSLTCPTTVLDAKWERIIAYYAAALLERPICECNNVQAFVEHWQFKMEQSGPENSVRISERDLDCPFGTRRGAIFAWKRLRQGVGQALGQGVYIT